MSLESLYTALTWASYTDDGYSRTLGTANNGSGFIQPIGGREELSHLNLASRITARLYCDCSLAIADGDIVSQGGFNYVVLYSEQPNGISGVLHHKEILLGKVES